MPWFIELASLEEFKERLYETLSANVFSEGTSLECDVERWQSSRFTSCIKLWKHFQWNPIIHMNQKIIESLVKSLKRAPPPQTHRAHSNVVVNIAARISTQSLIDGPSTTSRATERQGGFQVNHCFTPICDVFTDSRRPLASRKWGALTISLPRLDMPRFVQVEMRHLYNIHWSRIYIFF